MAKSGKEGSLSDRWLENFKNNKLVAFAIVASIVLAGIITFVDNVRQMASLFLSVAREETVPVFLPNDTGWIFCGYYVEEQHGYIEDPACKVINTKYKEHSDLPRLGDRIRVVKTRKLVIKDFAVSGLTKQFDPPWTKSVLDSTDYTGINLPPGVVLAVRDISAGHFADRPLAIWVRIGID